MSIPSIHRQVCYLSSLPAIQPLPFSRLERLVEGAILALVFRVNPVCSCSCTPDVRYENRPDSCPTEPVQMSTHLWLSNYRLNINHFWPL